MKHILISIAAVCILCGSAFAQGTFAPPSPDGWLGIFSGGVVSNPESLRKDTVKLVFETCGSEEYPERIRQNAEQLRGLGINAATYVSPDTAHEWQTWRRSLYHFLQLIFK